VLRSVAKKRNDGGSGDADHRDFEFDSPIAVACASFGAIFDPGLIMLLARTRDLEVVGERLALSELEAAVASCSTHVAVLEGGQVAGDLRVLKRLRTVLSRVGIVVLAYRLSEPYSRQLLACGASACLSWDASPSELLLAIRLAAAGKSMLVPSGRQSPDQTSMRLTSREREVLVLAQSGLANGEIASILHISENTVHAHMKSIFVKLQIKRRRDLVAISPE
jgi:DNA-binding NarL/FixJ family response regulator